MTISRRNFGSGAIAFAASGSFTSLIASSGHAVASPRMARHFDGYGELQTDPDGLLALPKGFRYRVFSREGDAMSQGASVPSSHDGMGAFSAGPRADVLIRNHEMDVDDVAEDGLIAVPHLKGITYDPEAPGGTTTLWVARNRKLLFDAPSLAGTLDNCAGGVSPWHTWLSCEETTETLLMPHGYVFEVDPLRGGNPEPIRAMGRFEHEAVAFDRRGRAYLTEDADSPFGLFYRFLPRRPLGGRGSLHAGGLLQAMSVQGLDTDLSIVLEPGSVFNVNWVDIPNADPGDDEMPTREQGAQLGATPIQKCEGCWTAPDGTVWFIGSRGDGPNAEDEEDRSAAEHAGQVWRYDPVAQTIELIVVFPKGTPFDEPDNITVGPHGYALACTDGDDDQWLVGVGPSGNTFPFALNQLNDEEFAGATFSPDGDTLYVNIQGPPGLTFAIWGPWRKGAGHRRG